MKGSFSSDLNSRLKRWLPWTIKLGATYVLVSLALRKVPLRELALAFKRVEIYLALASMITFQVLIIPIEATRFWLAGRHLDERPASLGSWMVMYLESRPFMYLLPAAVGAEGLIWLRLRRQEWQHSSCAFTVFLTRLWGLGIWALLAGLALPLAPGVSRLLDGFPSLFTSSQGWVMGGVGIILCCLSGPKLLGTLEHVSMAQNWLQHSILLGTVSILTPLAAGICMVLASHASGTPFPLSSALGLLAFLNFAAALPVSIGGIGVQEALVLRFGITWGYPLAHLLAFSALIHAQRLLLAFVGGFVYLRLRTDGPHEPK